MTQPELDLPDFEGQEVIASRVKITGAGDGLSEALDLEPEALHFAETRYMLLEVKVDQINHRADKKSGKMVRVHSLATQNIAEIDPDVAKQMLTESDERKRRIRRELAKAKGIEELPIDEGGEDAPVEDDVDGQPAAIDPEATPDNVHAFPASAPGDPFAGNDQTNWDYPQPDPQPAAAEDPVKAPKSSGRRRRAASEETADGS